MTRICKGYEVEEHYRWTLVRVHWREGDGTSSTEERRFYAPVDDDRLAEFLDVLHGDAP